MDFSRGVSSRPLSGGIRLSTCSVAPIAFGTKPSASAKEVSILIISENAYIRVRACVDPQNSGFGSY